MHIFKKTSIEPSRTSDKKLGKLNKQELQRLLSCIKKDPRVLVPPLPGYDSGVHFLGDKCMVVSTDPCTDVPNEWFGWLLVNYAASDVALFGAKPEFCTINLLGPPKTDSIVFERTMNQICKAANELDMVVVTGHTGTYKSIGKMVGVCTAYGMVEKEKLILPSNIQNEDLILQIKEIGLELLANFAFLKKKLSIKLFGVSKTQQLMQLIKMQSCVKEALNLAKSGFVDAMHDATEGGLVSTLNELANASDVGFQVEKEKIEIRPEIKKIQKNLKLSEEEILSMSSTGSIIAAINPHGKERIKEEASKQGYSTSIIGKFTKNKDRILISNKKKSAFSTKVTDPYNKILFGKE
jgi:hydrogenase maturation factor